MDERYKIVFSGELQGRVGAEEVIERLVETFKMSETRARVLVLDGSRHVVKKNLDARYAERYRAALEQAGLTVHVEPMDGHNEELTLAPLTKPSAAVSESQQTAPVFTTVFEPSRCLACGSMHVENGVCRDCGVAREEQPGRQKASPDGSAHHNDPRATESNPYQTPRADLRPWPLEGEIRGPKGVPADSGWRWIAGGFGYFKSNPFAWILTFVVFVGVSILLGLVPVIGGLANSVLMPVFIAGFMYGVREQDRRKDFFVEHLFAGFRENLGTLALVGLLYLVGIMLIVVLMGILLFGSIVPLTAELGQAGLGGQDADVLLKTLGPMGLVALLFGMLLAVPLAMAVLFAPALVMLDGLGAVEAMKQSFMGCLKNILPFLVYGILAFVLLVIAMVPLGLGLLVAWPTLTAAIYVAYKDIFFE